MDRGGIVPVVTKKYRVGDIRHCFADISTAERLLGYRPQVSFEEGLSELTGWLATQRADDRVIEASNELERRGLTV
jgi:dTDP-L-rhamnose 4-epimerase